MVNISFLMPPIRGGGPRNVYTISRMLNERGISSSILSPYDANDYIKNSYAPNLLLPSRKIYSIINKKTSRFDRLSHLNFPLFGIKNLVFDPLTLRNIGNIDLYVATAWQTVYSSRMISKYNKKPLIYFIQAYESEFGNNRVYYKLADKTYSMNIPMFTQSKWLKNFIETKFSSNVYWIGLGINHRAFKDESANKKKQIFTIARPERDKGFDVFVKAINLLWRERNDFKVVIAGSRNALSGKDINFKYEFLDWIKDDHELAKLYSESIFVNTGKKEAIPMPPVEAMASGSTVVISNIEGAREYAINNHNCLVCDPENPNSFSIAISELLDNGDLREKLSKNGIVTSKQYNWDDVLNRFMAFVKDNVVW